MLAPKVSSKTKGFYDTPESIYCYLEVQLAPERDIDKEFGLSNKSLALGMAYDSLKLDIDNQGSQTTFYHHQNPKS